MKKSLFALASTVLFFTSMTAFAAYQPAIRVPFYDANTNTISMFVADLGGSALAVAGFEYGLDESYGYVTGISMVSAPGYVTANPHLTCNANYHFRAFVTNAGGTTNGTALSSDMVATCVGIPETVVVATGGSGGGTTEQTPAATEEVVVTPETPTEEAPAPTTETEKVVTSAPDEVTPEPAPVEEPVVEVPTEEVTAEPVVEEMPVVEEVPTEEVTAEPVVEEEIPLAAFAGLSGFIAQPWLWGVLGILVVLLLVYRSTLKRAHKWEKEDGGDSAEIN